MLPKTDEQKSVATSRRKKTIVVVLAGVVLLALLIGAAVRGVVFVRANFTDPAVDLAYAVSRESKKLRNSSETEVSFVHVPDAAKARKSPRFNSAVRIEVIVRSKTKGGSEMKSVIMVNNWYATSYQNRHVTVEKPMKAEHGFGVPFKITLEKRGNEIYWIGLE